MRRRPAALLMTLGTGAVLAYFNTHSSTIHMAIYGLAGQGSAAALLVAIRRSPAASRAWHLVAAFILLSSAADLAYDSWIAVTGHQPPFPSPVDVVYLAAYPFLIAGVVGFTRSRTARRTGERAMGVLIATAGSASWFWIFAFDPTLHDQGSVLEKSVAVAYPAFDLVILGVFFQVLVTGRRELWSRLLLLGIVAQLVGDVAYTQMTLANTYHDGAWPDGAWQAAYVLLAAAGVIATGTVPASTLAPRREVTRWTLLALALLSTPIAIVYEYGFGPHKHGVALAVFMAVTSVIVLFRIAQLTGQTARSETRFEELVRSLEAMVWERAVTSSDYLYISPHTSDLLGYPLEQLMADGFWDSLIHPEDLPDVEARRAEARKGTGAYDYEYRVRAKDGRWVWLRVLARIEDGRARGVSIDITEQRRARIEAEHSASLLRATLEATQDGILVSDLRGNITLFNERYLDLLGISEEETRLNVVERVRGTQAPKMKDPDAFVDRVQRLYADPEAEGFDVLELVDDRIIERATRPQRWGGKTIGRVWSFRDVTDQRRAQEAQLYSQRRFQETLEKMTSLIAVGLDVDGRVTFCNDALLALSGYERHEVIGRYWLDAFPPPDELTRRRSAAYIAQISTGVELRPWENVMGLPTGEARLMVWHETPLRDADGNVTGCLGVGEDVTERRRAEQALRESEERFRTVFQASPHGMNVVTLEGRLVESNSALERLLGYSKEELLSMAFSDFTHPDDLGGDLALFADLVAGKRDAYELEKRYLRKDGSEVWARLTAFAVRDAVGRPSFAIGLMEDITERKTLEDHLRHAQKLEAVGRLAGGIAHDFNNLLTAITGYTQFLLGGLPDGPLRRDAEEIDRAASRAAGLTRQLLAFSRRQVLQPKVLDLNELVAELERLLRRLIGEDIGLEVSLEHALPRVEADPGQLEQVIVNLVVNARDAMPLGGRLRIATAAARGRVRLTVEDTGVGMDEATRSHLFEPFFTTKEQGKGTGLGLATVYGIVQQSNAEITVESEPGAGTRFEILFPAVTGPCPTVEDGVAATRASSGSETVLLVEDEPIVRDLVVSVLERQGYSVLEAPGGEAALDLAGDFDGHIDLMVTDVVMPHMSGRELAERLRLERPSMRVLYTSGYDEAAIRHHGLEQDELSFLPKPFTPDSLARRVREVLDAA